MKKNYTLSLATKTLTITKAFEEAVATNIESPEYELYTRLMREIPNLKVVRRTHKTPSKYTTKSGEKYTYNQYKHLTYETMERVLPIIGRQEQMDDYNTLREVVKEQPNAYKQVRDWFLGEFLDFRKNPLSNLTNSGMVDAQTAETSEEKKVA